MPKKTMLDVLAEVNKEAAEALSTEENAIFEEGAIKKIAEDIRKESKKGEEEGEKTKTAGGGKTMTNAEINKLATAILDEFKDNPDDLVKLAANIQGQGDSEDEISKQAAEEFATKVATASIEGRAEAQFQFLSELAKNAEMDKEAKGMPAWLLKALKGTGKAYTRPISGLKGILSATKGKKPAKGLAIKKLLAGLKGKGSRTNWAKLLQSAAAYGVPTAGAGVGLKYALGKKSSEQTKLADDEKGELEFFGKVAAYSALDENCKIAAEAGTEVPEINIPDDEVSQAAAQSALAASNAMEEAGQDPSELAAELVQTVAEDPASAAATIVESQSPEEAAKVIANAVVQNAGIGA